MSAKIQNPRSELGMGIYAGERIKDDLDRESYNYLQECMVENGSAHALDLGGGLGAHTIRLASTGAKVTMVDLLDSNDRFEMARLQGHIGDGAIRTIIKDWRDLNQSDDIGMIDVLYSQRSLSYISFLELRSLFAFLSNLIKPSTKFYISLNGIDSLYGTSHPLKDSPVEERFGYVADDIKEKLNVEGKMCVYSHQDIEEKLFANLPYRIDKIQETRFGNIQVFGSAL